MQISIFWQPLQSEIFNINNFLVVNIKLDIRRILIFYLELTIVHALTDRKLLELVVEDHILRQPPNRILFILLHHETLFE